MNRSISIFSKSFCRDFERCLNFESS